MATISAVSPMGRKPRQATGRRTGKERQEAPCAAGLAANDFLKQQFLPLYYSGTLLPDKDKAEHGLQQSLSILSEKGIEVIVDYKNKNYPYNMLLVQADLQQQMAADKDGYELSIVSDDADNIFLSAREVYDTGTTLYFIPVIPLCRLSKQKQYRQSSDLLLSVFAYLHYVAGVPYYRDGSSALSYYYEMTEEWLRNDLDGYNAEDQCTPLSELYKACYYGDLLQRRIYNPIHLDSMAKRLDNFRACCDFDLNCFHVAQSFYHLWQQFPNAKVFDHIPHMDEEAIRAEQYVSFIADNQGWLFENIADTLNNEFNECAYTEQPTIETLFSDDEISGQEDLGFEQQLFPLIADLCSLLNEIP